MKEVSVMTIFRRNSGVVKIVHHKNSSVSLYTENRIC